MTEKENYDIKEYEAINEGLQQTRRLLDEGKLISCFIVRTFKETDPTKMGVGSTRFMRGDVDNIQKLIFRTELEMMKLKQNLIDIEEVHKNTHRLDKLIGEFEDHIDEAKKEDKKK